MENRKSIMPKTKPWTIIAFGRKEEKRQTPEKLKNEQTEVQGKSADLKDQEKLLRTGF